MDNKLFTEKCIEMVVQYYNNTLKININEQHVYIVWLCKTLQNNKALLSTNIPDTRYYEITYNGDKKEFYFDSYVKEKNICVEAD